MFSRIRRIRRCNLIGVIVSLVLRFQKSTLFPVISLYYVFVDQRKLLSYLSRTMLPEIVATDSNLLKL